MTSSARHHIWQRPANKLFIWFRCIGSGLHLKQGYKNDKTFHFSLIKHTEYGKNNNMYSDFMCKVRLDCPMKQFWQLHVETVQTKTDSEKTVIQRKYAFQRREDIKAFERCTEGSQGRAKQSQGDWGEQMQSKGCRIQQDTHRESDEQEDAQKIRVKDRERKSRGHQDWEETKDTQETCKQFRRH